VTSLSRGSADVNIVDCIVWKETVSYSSLDDPTHALALTISRFALRTLYTSLNIRPHYVYVGILRNLLRKLI